MSEWNRNDRDREMRGREFEERHRREGRGQEWSAQGRQQEQRSFGANDREEWGRRGPEGSEGSRMSGGPGYGAQSYRGGQDYSSQRYGGEGYGSREFGRQDYGGQGYGAQNRQGYGGDQRPYGQGAESFGDPNDEVRRVTDGEAGRPGLFGMGNRGEHRGRGPKNYTRSDERIREDVSDRLADDPMLDASEIEVRVSSSEVTLTGTVNSREDKRRAEDLVEQVSGVRHVQNNLRVQPTDTRTGAGWAAGSQSTTGDGGRTTAERTGAQSTTTGQRRP